MGIIYKNGTYYGGGSGGGGAEVTVDNELSSTSENPVQNKVIKAELDNKQDADDLMTSADMDDVVTPLPGVASRLPRYSTEEQIVGYWIDGKPLYQKTVQLVSQDSVWVEVAHNISNIKQVCSINGVVGDSTGFFVTGGCVGASYERVFFQANTLSVKCYVAGNSVLINKPVYITIQYTKTTD